MSEDLKVTVPTLTLTRRERAQVFFTGTCPRINATLSLSFLNGAQTMTELRRERRRTYDARYRARKLAQTASPPPTDPPSETTEAGQDETV